MNCGKLMASTLQSMGKGTADDIIEEISYVTGQSEEMVEPDVKQILRSAVREGFLTKEGNMYLFPKHAYEVDARAVKRGRSSTTRRRIDSNRKAIASKSQNKRRKEQSKNESRSRSRSRSPQSKAGSGSK